MAKKKKTDEEIKAEIVDGACKLIVRYGYKKTSMEDIAKSARKGKSTLYYYYKSKDEILIAVISRETLKMRNNIVSTIETCSTASEKLQKLFETILAEVKKMSALFYILIDDIYYDDEIKLIMRTKYNQSNIDIISKILNYGIENNEFSKITKDKVLDVARLIDKLTGLLISDEIRENWESSLLLLMEMFISSIK